MSREVKLKAEKREDWGKEAARKLRQGGRVPAVLYGKGSDTMSLSVDAHEVRLLFQSISVENTIVDLDITGEKAPVQTLVREIQIHPLRPDLLHVDFYRIRKGVKVELDVPVRLNGVPEGVKTSGGTLQQVVHSIPIKCLPNQIPSAVEIDVSGLGVGDAVHVSDLRLPDVEILLDPEQTICTVAAQKAIVEEAPAEALAEAPAEGEEEGEESEE